MFTWAGKPISGLKIIAKQVPPIKGYEQFETVSGPDGAFKFEGLYPSSAYVIAPWAQSWTTKSHLQVTAAPEGETLLSQPLVIRLAWSRDGSKQMDPASGKPRFAVSNEGVITDSVTGLEWLVGPDHNIKYGGAERWVQHCPIGGGGWRMPTRAELRTLYMKGLGTRNMPPVFKTTGWWVWAEPRDSEKVWIFYFTNGKEDYFYRNRYSKYMRVFGVRTLSR